MSDAIQMKNCLILSGDISDNDMKALRAWHSGFESQIAERDKEIERLKADCEKARSFQKETLEFFEDINEWLRAL